MPPNSRLNPAVMAALLNVKPKERRPESPSPSFIDPEEWVVDDQGHQLPSIGDILRSTTDPSAPSTPPEPPAFTRDINVPEVDLSDYKIPLMKTHKTDTEWVIAAEIDPSDMSRLTTESVLAGPDIEEATQRQAQLVHREKPGETMAFSYYDPMLNPNYAAPGNVRSGETEQAETATGHPEPGALSGAHGHPTYEKDEFGNLVPRESGMLDEPNENKGFGDTELLKKYHLPMATEHKGSIGWHELYRGQLIFRAPIDAVKNQRHQFSANPERATEAVSTAAMSRRSEV